MSLLRVCSEYTDTGIVVDRAVPDGVVISRVLFDNPVAASGLLLKEFKDSYRRVIKNSRKNFLIKSLLTFLQHLLLKAFDLFH